MLYNLMFHNEINEIDIFRFIFIIIGNYRSISSVLLLKIIFLFFILDIFCPEFFKSLFSFLILIF